MFILGKKGQNTPSSSGLGALAKIEKLHLSFAHLTHLSLALLPYGSCRCSKAIRKENTPVLVQGSGHTGMYMLAQILSCTGNHIGVQTYTHWDAGIWEQEACTC